MVPSDQQAYIKSDPNIGLIFNPIAVSIVILDRWGQAIWKKERGQKLEPIIWDGLDSYGCSVSSGSLMCKITYPDRKIIYVPFVFIQK